MELVFYGAIKLIAIGNRMMKDDGIAITVVEKMMDKLKEQDIEVIIGETDYQFCFYSLRDDHFTIILDAASSGGEPGSIHIYSLQEAIESYQKGYSQHDISLLDLIGFYSKPSKGYLIAIEVKDIDFGVGLSETLISKFDDICLEVENTIKKILEEVRHY
jgi:hydrogenase maturation protease